MFQGGDSSRLEEILVHIPTLLQPEDGVSLLRPINMVEVKHDIWELDPESSARPDGFIGHFFQHCWDIVAEDVL